MKLTDRFPACLAETLKHEGGWSDVKEDPGGPTMKGVTIAVYAGHLGITLAKDRKGKLIRDAQFEAVKVRLRNISDKDLRAIYGKNYWGAARCGDLPAGVDLAVFDVAVNSGVGRAAKLLQKVTGCTQDGHIGAATLAAVKNADPLEVVRGLMDARRAFLQGLSTFWKFGKGWMSRCDAVEATALDMAGASQIETSYVTTDPLPDADEQAATQGRAVPVPASLTESRSIWAGIMSVITIVAGVVTDLAKGAWEWLIWLIGLAPSIYSETKTTLTPMQEMAGWFGKNIPKVTVAIALVCIVVFVVRHAMLRMEANS